MKMLKVASVALDLKLDKTFDYSIPEALAQKIQLGHLVEVPLKGSLKKGIVLNFPENNPPYALKPIHKILDPKPFISEELLQLARWMSFYYCTPLSQILPTLVPSAIKKTKHKEQFYVIRAKTREEIRESLKHIRSRSLPQAEILDYMLKVEGKVFLSELLENTGVSRSPLDSLVNQGILLLEKARVERSPLIGEEYFRSKPKKLSNEQQEALDKIESGLSKNIYETHLLFGVTGSGKTEVYLQAIAKALKNGKGVIMLVPEIALTSQTIEQFRSRFEGHIAILHYRLSVGEKYDEWKKIQRGDAKIVIGARSAIFSPVKNLGLILVDEEHEGSYKQTESMPSYHARDVAVMRGFFSKALVVLGSATPSIESYHNALTGKYTLSKLLKRPKDAPLPHVTVIDMKKEYEKKKGITIFSESLLNHIEKRLKIGEQTVLFLNRRGFHTLMLCSSCGESIKCSKCDLSLTFHKKVNTLCCHLCNETLSPPPQSCPNCKAERLMRFKGIGTEQVEMALHAIFPNVQTLRLDADTTKHKGSHQKLYRLFRTGKADILIGTQMLAKGLHFPEVTLVGILNSDISLNLPDFRSSEITFQLLTQVAGRAGRGIQKGEVLIQTCVPENSTIQHAANQDFEKFFHEEYEGRKLFQFPPFAQLAKVRFIGKDPILLQNFAENFRLKIITELPKEFEITQVDSPGHAKIKEFYRLQFIIKGPKILPTQKALIKIKDQLKDKRVNIHLDINPISLFF